MRIVLDTSALFYPRALRSIDPRWPIVLPVVAFLERARQLHRSNRMTPEAYRRLVDRAGWYVEPLDVDLAVDSPAHTLEADAWRRLARDALIAGHVRPDDELWTANPTDFLRIGLRGDQVLDVTAAFV